MVCAKCGGRGNKIDVRPNWKEQPLSESLTNGGEKVAENSSFTRALL
jgi:hypothetical protein